MISLDKMTKDLTDEHRLARFYAKGDETEMEMKTQLYAV